MVESTGDPSVHDAPSGAAPPPAAAAEAAPADLRPLPKELSVRALLEVGAHFGHQTRRWDPRMKPFIYGERHGIHILNLDQTYERMLEALDFVRERVAQGGKVLFVGTKRQAQAPVRLEAERCGQFYVNNRWLGGMLTNFRTVKKSIERFKQQLELLGDEEKVAELSKKDLSRINRSVTKYRKSLDGIQEMTRLPDLLFVVDVSREHIALSEARRLGIPIVAVVDSNCSPEGIDFVIPGNDDAIRAIQFYCHLAAEACAEGATLHNERIQAEAQQQPKGAEGEAPTTGRRVVEIKQQPRGGRRGGPRSGATRSAGGPRGGEATETPEPAAAAGAAEAKPAAAAAEPKPAAEPPSAPTDAAAPES